jgi:hypothetical protein
VFLFLFLVVLFLVVLFLVVLFVFVFVFVFVSWFEGVVCLESINSERNRLSFMFVLSVAGVAP